MGDTREARAIARLPALDPLLGYLPPSPVPYNVTLSDVHDLFVARAPYRERREVLFAALSIYSTLVWEEIPQAKIWIDGGFATHKAWGAPDDVDVVVVAENVGVLTKGKMAAKGLFTMSDVTAKIGQKRLPEIEKISPFGGLIDAYFATSLSSELIKRQLTQVRGPDGDIIPGIRKGIMEVRRGIEP
jgi:hypothetical protein